VPTNSGLPLVGLSRCSFCRLIECFEVNVILLVQRLTCLRSATRDSHYDPRHQQLVQAPDVAQWTSMYAPRDCFQLFSWWEPRKRAFVRRSSVCYLRRMPYTWSIAVDWFEPAGQSPDAPLKICHRKLCRRGREPAGSATSVFLCL